MQTIIVKEDILRIEFPSGNSFQMPFNYLEAALKKAHDNGAVFGIQFSSKEPTSQNENN